MRDDEHAFLHGDLGIGDDGANRLLLRRLIHLDEETTVIRRLMGAAGRPFSVNDGASTDGAGLGIVQIQGPSNGQLWRVESIGVSVAGASAAAVVTAYLGQNDERNLLPGFFLANLNGNAPSRGVMAPPRPGLIWGGVPLLIVVRGGAVSQQGGIQVRVQGRVEEIAEVSGRLGDMPAPVTVGQA